MHLLLACSMLLIAFAMLFAREVAKPASGARCDRRWQVLATVLNLSQLTVALVGGYVLERSLRDVALLDLSHRIGPLAGGSLAFLLASFVAYWWHRATHRSDLLWRVFHQLHHSPRRIETHTAFFVHPLDTAAATSISCLACYLVLGLDYRSAAVALLLAGLFNLYIHSDTRSPRWLGYIVQRPEMHRVHHRRGHHADNYGLPLWDLLFGTWADPAERVHDCGFDPPLDGRVLDMLAGRDVHAWARAQVDADTGPDAGAGPASGS